MKPSDHTTSGTESYSMWKRPMLMSALSIFTWIYYGIMALLFLIAIFYSGWITEVINQYIADKSWSTTQVTLLFLIMFALHATAFSGVVLMWNGHRTGYYLFALPTILITIFHIFRPEISWLTTAIYAVLVILFGLFYREMKNSAQISY